MEYHHLVAFNLALLFALASPGPAFIYSVQTTVSSGRLAGIVTGVGLAFMPGIWTAFALLGLEGLLNLFPWAYSLIKTIGACYLIYIACRTWHQAKNSVGLDREPKAKKFFIDGLLVNLANPKSVLFAASVIVIIFPKELSGVEQIIIVANQFLIEGLFYLCLALLFSSNLVLEHYRRVKPLFDRLSAFVLGIFGFRLVLD